jgi:hypothetical protein
MGSHGQEISQAGEHLEVLRDAKEEIILTRKRRVHSSEVTLTGSEKIDVKLTG